MTIIMYTNTNLRVNFNFTCCLCNRLLSVFLDEYMTNYLKDAEVFKKFLVSIKRQHFLAKTIFILILSVWNS